MEHAEKPEEVDYMLNLPLPGQEAAPPSPWQAEDEGASFMALMTQVKGE